LEFTPLWRGNEISNKKRLGRYAYPNLDKEVVQDLGMNSRDIPLTVYFDGPDNDIEARNFETALYEPETWQVTHPVYGLLKLQLVSYKFAVEPVDSGNVTVFETEWIEPAGDEEIAPVTDLASSVESAVIALNEASIKDVAAVSQKSISQVKVASSAVKHALFAVKGAVKSANAKTIAIQNKLNNMVNEVFLDIASIAGGIIELIQAPALCLILYLQKLRCWPI
jgi:prophage DNA circulation protein